MRIILAFTMAPTALVTVVIISIISLVPLNKNANINQNYNGSIGFLTSNYFFIRCGSELRITLGTIVVATDSSPAIILAIESFPLKCECQLEM